MATSNPLTKVARQHETTWTQLHKRISDVPFRFEDVFPQEIATFLRNKAVSLSFSEMIPPAFFLTEQHLATKDSAFLVSPEIFDVLNKLLKNDEDNASGDAMLLCKLFSGEPSSYNYSTEKT